jgi:1-phosphatidylinositol-4-phosphate 5-kinase
MPSYLAEQNSSIFSANPDILHLDPSHQLGFGATKERVHEGAINHNHARTRPVNESFDDSSITSTHDSDVSDTTPMPVNGNGTRPTSMNSLANGTEGPVLNGKHDKLNGSYQTERPLTNGSTPHADHTALHHKTQPAYSHPIDHSHPAQNTHVQQNDVSSAASSGRQSPADLHQRHSKRSTELPHPLSPIPSDIEAPYKKTSVSLTPATPKSDSNSSPQRLSTSAFYPSGASTPSTSALASAAGTSTLKQRNNLEVPRNGPRSSKDGLDTAQASGRFSPTTVPTGRRASLSLARRPTRSMQSDAPRDEIVPDEDAQRWAEAYRQKRASKRKKKEEEDDERVVVGTKVDESHANWVTAYNMLTGIRVSVSRTNAKLDRELTSADFEAKQKSTFDM